MKNGYLLFLIFLVPLNLQAQFKPTFEYKTQLNQSTWLNQQILNSEINRYSDLVPKPNGISNLDTTKTATPGTMKYNKYGDLLNDDPTYTKKRAVWFPIIQIIIQEVVLNLFDHYVMHFDWATVGFKSWNKTVLHSGLPWNDGWEWDNARFGNDFLLHPYTGASYFNAARSSGYNFWESSIFVFGGSYLWKLFGENGGPEYKPAKNSIIATTLGGMVMGE